MLNLFRRWGRTQVSQSVDFSDVDDEPVFSVLEPRLLLSAFVVDSLADSNDANPGDGVALDDEGRVTLRAAIEEVNWLNGESHAIGFAAGLTGVISLEWELGELLIDSNVSIEGSGADQLTIDGQDRVRIFKVDEGAAVTIANLTLTGGYDVSYGGTIYSLGDLILNDVVVTDSKSHEGGGVYSSGSMLNINRCVFSYNEAFWGGGIYSYSDETTVVDSQFYGNQADAGGGGIYDRYQLSLVNSSVYENEAEKGGGVYIFNNGVIRNSTLSNNYAELNGGGVYILSIAGNRIIDHSTIIYNRADRDGGGGGIYVSSSVPALHVSNSIVALNGESDLSGDFSWSTENMFSNGHNLFTQLPDINSSFDTDLVGVDPLLGLLDFRSGLTPFYPLLLNSPAIDGADPGSAAEVDQVGNPRPHDGDWDGDLRNDIGAVEYQMDAIPGLVHGHVKFDLDGDGVVDAEAPGVADIEVNFYLDDGDGLFQPAGQDLLVKTILSNRDGAFLFETVPGTYWSEVNGDSISYGAGYYSTPDEPTLLEVSAQPESVEVNFAVEFMGDYLVVTTLEDQLDEYYPANGISLREAISFANQDSDEDTITFDTSLTGELRLIYENGVLSIGSDVNIEGPGAEIISINGQNRTQIFNVAQYTQVSISGLELLSGGGPSSLISGGAIYSLGDLYLDRMVIHDSDTNYYGGGICADDGLLSISNSSIYHNSSSLDGGGIYSKVDTVITACLIEANYANNGGGISVRNGRLNIQNSSIVRNFSNYSGGGLKIHEGEVTLENVTFALNSAGSDGGAISATKPLGSTYYYHDLNHVTIVRNNARRGQGGGLFTGDNHIRFRVNNSIISQNTADNAGADFSGQFNSYGYNILGETSYSAQHYLSTDLVGVDPLLGDLLLNGGDTPTFSLQRGSPAIDGGSPYSNTITDQRGFYRPIDGDGDGVACVDIGAFETGSYYPDRFARVSGFVWYDSNENGIFDDDEVVADNVPVLVYDENDTFVIQTFTDTVGQYLCEFISPGQYTLSIDLPIMYALTQMNQGGDDSVDSDFDPQTYSTELFVAEDNGQYAFAAGLISPTITVNSLADTHDADPDDGLAVDEFGQTTLRAAIEQLEEVGRYAAIEFSADLTGEILLELGDLQLLSDISIYGPGVNLLSIRSNGDSRIFNVDQGVSAEVTDMTLQDGYTKTNFGGAIYHRGDMLILNHVAIHNCESAYRGGAIYLADGEFKMINSAILNNRSAEGGAIYSYKTPVTIINSTISGNTSLENRGVIFISHADLKIISSTVTDNKSKGGTCSGIEVNFASLYLADSVVAGNADANSFIDIKATSITSNGYNVVGRVDNPQDYLPSDLIGVDPLLSLLQFPYDSLPVHVPLPGSPLIDGGDPQSTLTTDQRGHARPVDGDDDGEARVDIGAVEVDDFSASHAGGRVWSDWDGDGLQDADEQGLAGVTVNLLDAGQEQVGEALITGVNGEYQFINLQPGEYYVQFVLPGNHLLSPLNAGDDDSLDSDALAATGMTELFIAEANRLHQFDAGVMPEVITVDSVADTHDANEVDGVAADVDGQTTLRAAIEQANAVAGPYVIVFALPGSSVISLAEGQLVIGSDVRIHGPGAELLTVSGNDQSRVFQVSEPSQAVISDITIADGSVGYYGGGIENFGNLSLKRVIVNNNKVIEVPLSRPSKGYGGGICNQPGGVLLIINSVLANNISGVSGGGAFNFGYLSVVNSLITSNTAVYSGGGIYNEGIAELVNVTITENSSYDSYADGGGVYNRGQMDIAHCTIARNHANSRGGGICASYGYVKLYNSVIAYNTSDGGQPDMRGDIISNGHNLIGIRVDNDGFTDTDFVNVDPYLGLLGDYGGATQTIALLATSPLIDAAAGDDAPQTDGRGFARYDNLAVDNTGSGKPDYADIGAYELQEESQPHIVGVAWYDNDWDGLKAGDEQYVFKMGIKLYRDNGDGVLDAEGDELVDVAVSSRLGRFVFSGMSYGDYWVLADFSSAALSGGMLSEGANPKLVRINGDGLYHSIEFPIRPLETFVVTTLDDELDHSNDSQSLSLREAIALAKVLPTDDEIIFAAGLTGVLELDVELGEMVIDSIITIVGPGQEWLTIDAMDNCGIFHVDAGVEFGLADLTLTGGNAGDGGNGGAIYSSGGLTLRRVCLTGNYADDGFGGAVFHDGGALTVEDCQIVDNAAEYGGGIYSSSAGPVVVMDSLVADNHATKAGGGILVSNSESLVICGSTIRGNHAGEGGGGVFNYYTATDLQDTVFVGNHSDRDGGGLLLYCKDDGPLKFSFAYVTFTSNTAARKGGGIFSEFDARPSEEKTVAIYASTFMYNAAEDGGGIYSEGPIELYTTDMRYNTAWVNGGGIYLDWNDVAKFVDCRIVNNAAVTGAGGGIMVTYPHDPVVESLVYEDNFSARPGGYEPPVIPQPLPEPNGDFNGDNMVGLLDLNILGDNFGQSIDPAFPEGDINKDYKVNLLDLDILGQNFNQPATAATGDLNGDHFVTLLDLDILGLNYNSISQSPKYFGDANGDGFVNLLDLDILGKTWGIGGSAMTF